MFGDPWPEDTSWVKTTALFSLPVLLVGFIGYRYLTTATPVSADQAVALFRAERAAVQSPSPDTVDQGPARIHRVAEDRDRPAQRERAVQKQDRPADGQASTQQVVASSTPESTRAGQDRTTTADENRSPRRSTAFTPGAPEEGVYSWDTDGYESFNGSRRAFPRETQRIVTRHGATSWTLHHYFSKERESWTDVTTAEDGYRTTKQRNKVVFGPVTRDVTITFSPPMVTGPMPPRVGTKWSGRWDGPTYGNYEGRYFDHGSMTIDGHEIEVWGIELLIHLRGETEGTTWAQVWISPETHMVVKEHYKQDVQTGPGTYRAEWTMSVRSLDPQR